MNDDTLARAAAAALSRTTGDFRAVTQLVRLSGGASQETYQLDVQLAEGARRYVLRRSPGGAAPVGNVEQIGMPAEAKVLRAVAAAGVPVARLVAELDPADGAGEGFIADWLEGETLGHRIVKAPALDGIRPRLATECGRILARIHGVDIAAHDLGSVLRTVDAAALVHSNWARYQSFGSPQPMIDYTAQWLLAHLPPPVAPALVHADFRNGNLMIDAQGIVGVLDWEISHLGDPMRDLGWLCTASWRFGVDQPVGGFGDYADLFAGYEAESGRPVDVARVRFWEVFGSFWWAIGCLFMMQQYREGSDATVERPAIARRSSECQVDLVNLLLPAGEPAAHPGTRAATADEDADASMPSVFELVSSVRDFLRQDVANSGQDRARFLARVAANSLDIALRDLRDGPAARTAEQDRLQGLLGEDAPLPVLRRRLCEELRAGRLALDDMALTAHLRATVVNEARIDQPGYPGVRKATS